DRVQGTAGREPVAVHARRGGVRLARRGLRAADSRSLSGLPVHRRPGRNAPREAVMIAERLSSLESMLAGDHHRLDRAFDAIVMRAEGGDLQELEHEWLGC